MISNVILDKWFEFLCSYEHKNSNHWIFWILYLRVIVLIQVYHAEGIRGLYKGTTAVYLRIAPHTVIQLLAWDFCRRLYFFVSGKSGVATGWDGSFLLYPCFIFAIWPYNCFIVSKSKWSTVDTPMVHLFARS